jgi:hypothetical protein
MSYILHLMNLFNILSRKAFDGHSIVLTYRDRSNLLVSHLLALKRLRKEIPSVVGTEQSNRDSNP